MMKKVILAVLGVYVAATVAVAAAVYLRPQSPRTVPSAVPSVPEEVAPPTGSTFTLTEVAAHSTASDCWLVVRDGVYDVTAHIPKHPGGKQRILAECGTDVTSAFASVHPNRAWDLLAGYRIGTVAP